MTTMNVLDADGAPVAIEKPLAPGRAAAASSRPVALSNEDAAFLDGIEGALGTTAGAAVITDANGTIQQYLRGLITQWIAGTLKLGAGTSLIGKVKTKLIHATGSTLTRPANVTPYSIGDSVSNNATPGSVTANTVTIADLNDEPLSIERVRLVSTDTGFAAKAVRLWLYRSDPTANSGVVGGDNLAFSNKQAGFIGTLSGVFRTFSDGSTAVLVPDEGARIITTPGSGVQTLWWQLQSLDAPTPSANSTTFIPTFEGFQGGAN